MIPPAYVRRHTAPDAGAADRRRLLLLALEAGHAFLARARAALASGDVVAYVTDLQRTHDVLHELAHAPGRDDGTLGADVARLRTLLLGGLALARSDGMEQRIDEVLGAYAAVVDAWRASASAADAPG